MVRILSSGRSFSASLVLTLRRGFVSPLIAGAPGTSTVKGAS